MPFLARLSFVLLLSLSSATIADDKMKYPLPETNDGLRGDGPVRRYKWFRNLWERRRTEFAQNAPQQQGAVVFFGDSITQGWGNDFKGLFPGIKTANRGISGDTTRGMLLRLNEDVVSLNPSAVIMLMGTNDLEEGAAADVIVANIKIILDDLAKHNADMPIVLCEVMPSSASKKRPADSIKAINSGLRKIVSDRKNVTLLDTWTLFANEKGDAKKAEFPDLLHPNDTGYAMWAAALMPVLATLELAETAPKPFKPDDGFRSLFNGKDLTGWGLLPTTDQMLKSRERWQSRDPNAPPWPIVEEAVSFDGTKRSPDGRFAAINGRLVVTTPATGRAIQQLWTTENFDTDFTLKLQFRATPNADSGVFLRGKQLQCRDFLLAGPYKALKKYRPQGWNDLVIEVKGQTAHCTCNGEVLEEAFKIPASGPIGLEGDRGQLEYRYIQLQAAK